MSTNLKSLKTPSGVLNRLMRGTSTPVNHLIKLVESHLGTINPDVRKVLTPAFIKRWHASRGKSTLKWDKNKQPKPISALTRSGNVIRRVFKKGMSLTELKNAVKKSGTKLKISNQDVEKWYQRKHPKAEGGLMEKTDPFYLRVGRTTGKIDGRVLKRNPKWDEMLTKAWNQGFTWGRNRMYWHLRDNNAKDHPTHSYVARWLETREAYNTHRNAKSKGKTILKRPATGPSRIWGVDLKDMQNDEIDKYKYILGTIDLFTRKVWTASLKDKRGKTVADAMEKIIKSLPAVRRPRAIRSDVSFFISL